MVHASAVSKQYCARVRLSRDNKNERRLAIGSIGEIEGMDWSGAADGRLGSLVVVRVLTGGLSVAAMLT
jgi:chromosome condensin MukBEF ATPase and DNA-binding subunit MukB